MRETPKQIKISYSGENVCESGFMKDILSIIKRFDLSPKEINLLYKQDSRNGEITYTFSDNKNFPDSSRMEKILQNFNFLNMNIKKIEVNDGQETYTLKNKLTNETGLRPDRMYN